MNYLITFRNPYPILCTFKIGYLYRNCNQDELFTKTWFSFDFRYSKWEFWLSYPNYNVHTFGHIWMGLKYLIYRLMFGICMKSSIPMITQQDFIHRGAFFSSILLLLVNSNFDFDYNVDCNYILTKYWNPTAFHTFLGWLDTI